MWSSRPEYGHKYVFRVRAVLAVFNRNRPVDLVTKFARFHFQDLSYLLLSGKGQGAPAGKGRTRHRKFIAEEGTARLYVGLAYYWRSVP